LTRHHAIHIARLLLWDGDQHRHRHGVRVLTGDQALARPVTRLRAIVAALAISALVAGCEMLTHLGMQTGNYGMKDMTLGGAR